MEQTRDPVGQSIHALLREPRLDREGAVVKDGDDDAVMEDLAAATPFVTRLRPVATWAGVRVPVDRAMERFARGAPVDHLDATGVPHDEWMHFLVAVATVAGLLEPERLDPRTVVLRRGPDSDWLAHHPTAAWGGAVLEALLSDVLFLPRGLSFDDPDGYHVLPLLVFSYVVSRAGHGPRRARGQVDLDPVVGALTNEVAARGEVGAPTADEVVAGLRCIAALLVELGLVTWDPAPAPRIGTAQLTSLGVFAWMLWQADLCDEPPDYIDEFIRDHGYLRADGGYLDPTSAPVRPAWN